MSNHKTTHIRVDRNIKTLADMELPLYSTNEIFKAGVISLKAYNKAGKIVFGKNVWNKTKKK